MEFWPDYGPGPVWTDDGKPVDLGQLAAWLWEGSRLLREVRSALAAEYRVVVTEPWWGEEPT